MLNIQIEKRNLNNFFLSVSFFFSFVNIFIEWIQRYKLFSDGKREKAIHESISFRSHPLYGWYQLAIETFELLTFWINNRILFNKNLITVSLLDSKKKYVVTDDWVTLQFFISVLCKKKEKKKIYIFLPPHVLPLAAEVAKCEENRI